MTFGWPLMLFGLLLVPVLAAGYAVALRRRRRRAVVYSSVALIRAAAPRRSTWRRHMPVALLLAALAVLALGAARPQVQTRVPVSASSVILALDVSGSMCATDVTPNRLGAAQAAVRDFVTHQDGDTRIGLVAFSGFAQLVVAPTTNHADLLTAIDGLTTGRGTTIGSAILKSVDAIAQINPDVAPAGNGYSTPDNGPVVAVRPGSYAPEIVVLLTDGANTAGVAPADAAKIAAARGVRVYPIGFGTTHPTAMACSADQMGGSGFVNTAPNIFGGGNRPNNFLVADEPALKQVAAVTGGTYFSAQGAGQLQDVLDDLPRHVKLQKQDLEVSVVLVGLGALLLLGALWAAARWSTFPS